MTGDYQSTNTISRRVLLFVGGDPEFAAPASVDRPLTDAGHHLDVGARRWWWRPTRGWSEQLAWGSRSTMWSVTWIRCLPGH